MYAYGKGKKGHNKSLLKFKFAQSSQMQELRRNVGNKVGHAKAWNEGT